MAKDLGPEPKRPSSSYMFFNTSFVKKAREQDPELKNSDAFKLAGQKWKEMSDEEKAVYEKMADADKVRHEKQVAEREKKGFFLLEDKSKSTDPQNAKLFKPKKAKQGADEEEETKELQPKRAVSAYIYFSNEYREQLLKENPDYPQKEIMAAAGKKWNELEESQKAKYLQMNAKDKARQEKQLADLKNKGYFVLDDGSKSTDDKNVPKPSRTAKKTDKSLVAKEDS